MTESKTSPAAVADRDDAGGETRPPRRWEIALALLLPAAALLFAAWQQFRPPPALPSFSERSALALDLTRPDGLIETASLVSLPRDLLQVPLLRDLLTEDFVYYYEHNADRLGIRGALRRIAYEHDLDLRDSLIAELLDQPAQLALWRGRDGRLGHLLLMLQRGALARVLQPLGTVALDDRQLSQVGSLSVEGENVPVYRLRYNAGRSLLFAAYEDRMLVLSSPGLLLDVDDSNGRPGRDEAAVLSRMLQNGTPFARRFGLNARASTHRLTLSVEALTFGYGQFAPSVQALGFEYDADGWATRVALDSIRDLDFAPLWQAMPMGASLCAALPVSKPVLAPLLRRMAAADALPTALVEHLGGPSALCWYASSRLHTPLLVTRLESADGRFDADLGRAFERLVGASEPANGDRFEVQETASNGGVGWQRVVSSQWGLQAAAKAAEPDALSAERFFRVSLARHGDTVLFSLDDRLVDKAIATLEKRFPPLAEQLPTAHPTALYVAPAGLAALLEDETLSSLPADVEAVFRNAAERSLLPKLRALGQHRAYAVGFAEPPVARRAWSWQTLQWQPL